MTTAALLEADRVARRFGYRRVFHEVSLALAPGSVLTILGPNGSGKTTLLRVLSGLLRPSAGAVVRNGTVGLVSHRSMVYPALTARENLTFFGSLHGLRSPERIDDTLELLGLQSRADDRVASFSQGMVQRVTIARAMLAEPPILLLDEPTSSLDELGCDIVREAIDQHKSRGGVAVIVTHEYDRVASVTTSVRFLAQGTLQSADEGQLEPASVARRYGRYLTNA